MKKVLLAVAVIATLGLASCGVDDLVDSINDMYKTCKCTTVTTDSEGEEISRNTEDMEVLTTTCSGYTSVSSYGNNTETVTCVER